MIVDEIHERGVDEDLLLLVLRDLLPARPDLRVVLMSATLDAASFEGFFRAATTVHVPGATFPVEVTYLEGLLDASGIQFPCTALQQARTGRRKRTRMRCASLVTGGACRTCLLYTSPSPRDS